MGRGRIVEPGNRWQSAWIVVATLLATGCADLMGNRTEEFFHRFDITYQGEPVLGYSGATALDDELLFSVEPGDFPLSWDSWTEDLGAQDGKAPIDNILPDFSVETADIPDEAWRDDSLCLTGPMKFFDPDSLELVHELPAGTCLANGGKTVIVIEG